MAMAINGTGKLFITPSLDNIIVKMALQGQNWNNVVITRQDRLYLRHRIRYERDGTV